MKLLWLHLQGWFGLGQKSQNDDGDIIHCSCNEKLHRFRCHLSNRLPWRLLYPVVPCLSFTDRQSRLLPKHFKRRRVFHRYDDMFCNNILIWYLVFVQFTRFAYILNEFVVSPAPSNSDQQDYYNITFFVGKSLFTVAFQSDCVGRIDPRSNLEAPFCPWGGFPEALQSLLCYRQVLDKFFFSQPTSDSFFGYNNDTPVTSQIPQQMWEFREPRPFVFRQFGLCTTAAGWRGHGHGAPELGLVAWNTRWFEGSQTFIHEMCVPEGMRIYT